MSNSELRDLNQDTLDWLYARVGKVTSSNFSKVVSKPRKTDVIIKPVIDKVFDFGRAKKQQEIYERLVSLKCSSRNSVEKISDTMLKNLSDKGAIIATDIYEDKLSKQAESFMLSMFSELANGEPYEFDGKAIEHGNIYEPQARAEYEFVYDVQVKEQGLQLLSETQPDNVFASLIGASVDGLVGDDGLIEIKCPLNGARHLRCFVNNAVPEEHKTQIQGQLWVTGRKWCDFISFNPNYMMDVSHLKIFVKRVKRDEEYIDSLADKVIKFAKIFDEERRKLKLPESLSAS